MLKLIRDFFFGQRAKGEPIQPPTLKTLYPPETLSENQWWSEMKFGSRYGTRGSFYQTTF